MSQSKSFELSPAILQFAQNLTRPAKELVQDAKTGDMSPEEFTAIMVARKGSPQTARVTDSKKTAKEWGELLSAELRAMGFSPIVVPVGDTVVIANQEAENSGYTLTAGSAKHVLNILRTFRKPVAKPAKPAK